MASLSEPSSTSATFPLGSRLCVGGQRCTVLFAGLLSGTTPADAPWLGVEWDDPTRGKHDGSHGGVRYFRCFGPTAGSFLRPTSNKIQRPQPFLEVLLARYAPPPSPSSESVPLPTLPATGGSIESSQSEASTSSASLREEHVSLGSTSIQVMAPNLAKVRRRLGKVTALREVGADDALVGHLGPDEEEAMRSMGPWHTRRLNLSKSLLASWTEVDRIIRPLEELEGLDLTLNRIRAPPPPPEQLPSFGRLRELNLTATLLSLTSILDLERSLPNLKSLTFSSNHLKTFEIPSATDASDTNRPSAVDVPHAERRERWFPNLQELNLDWNDLDDWSRLGFLGELAGLRTLSLSNNRLPSLPLAVARGKTDPISFLPPKLETLRLARNAIDSWSTVDLLNERLGSLRVLWLGDNPLTAIDLTPRGGERVGEVDEEEAERRERRRVRDIRAGVIARVRGLTVLNGSEISAGERKAAELDYVLSQPPAFCGTAAGVAADRSAPGKARWDELADRHGSAQDSDQEGIAREVRKPSAVVLKDKLLDISFELPAPSTPSVVVLRLLPSTPLRTVLLKVSKHLDPSLAPAALHKTDGIGLCRPSGVDDEGGEELEGAKRTLRDLGVEPNETLRVVLR